VRVWLSVPVHAVNYLKRLMSKTVPRYIAVWYADTNTSSHADATVVNQTGNGTTLLGEASTSTEDWRALSTDVNVSRRAENSTTTESVLTKNFRNWLLSQLPLWALDNDSFGNQALLEEMIKKHRDDMVLVPGKQNCYHINFTL